MTFLIEIIFPLFFLCIMLAAMLCGGVALWCTLPDTKRETLQQGLLRVRGKPASGDSRPPIYAVHADGHLLYASGKEDVQAFLGTCMQVGSRQILQIVKTHQPATILMTCGNETILIEVHMPE